MRTLIWTSSLSHLFLSSTPSWVFRESAFHLQDLWRAWAPGSLSPCVQFSSPPGLGELIYPLVGFPISRISVKFLARLPGRCSLQEYCNIRLTKHFLLFDSFINSVSEHRFFCSLPPNKSAPFCSKGSAFYGQPHPRGTLGPTSLGKWRCCWWRMGAAQARMPQTSTISIQNSSAFMWMNVFWSISKTWYSCFWQFCAIL